MWRFSLSGAVLFLSGEAAELPGLPVCLDFFMGKRGKMLNLRDGR